MSGNGNKSKPKNPPSPAQSSNDERKKKKQVASGSKGMGCFPTIAGAHALLATSVAAVYYGLKYSEEVDRPLQAALEACSANIPIAAIFAITILIFVSHKIFILFQSLSGGYDNDHPRIGREGLTDIAARAHAAHLNHQESFAPFAAAVLAAIVQKVDPLVTVKLSLAFVALRVLYQFLYLINLSAVRSLVWMLGFVVNSYLFILAFAPANFSLIPYLHLYGLSAIVPFL